MNNGTVNLQETATPTRTRSRGANLSARDQDEICKWYGKGARVVPLSVVYGVNPTAIYNLLRRRGIALRANDRSRERNSRAVLLGLA